MFVPRYDQLTDFLQAAAAEPLHADVVEMPLPVFNLLLQLLLGQMAFDSADYLRRNPDVAQMLSRRQLSDARAHFLTQGYFEGRFGGCPVVDEDWYLATNPDVAAEFRQGAIASARDHYALAGAREWRSPSPQAAAALDAWHLVLSDRPAPDGERG